MKIRLISTFILLILFTADLRSIESEDIVFLKPTGEFENDFPVMQIWDDTDTSLIQLRERYLNSYISENIKLYQFVQNYLVNQGKTPNTEPVYVALSNNQGGFPEMGFYLESEGNKINKEHAGYVDFHKSTLNSAMDEAGSDCQILPHELGHIILKYLCIKGKENKGASTDMHYFPVVTDYWTAFNEGFAEHFEVIAHQLETNVKIKKGIEEDLDLIPVKTEKQIKGYKHDFTYPFRIGFYRATTIAWFQNYEMYRRHAMVHNGDIKYKSDIVDIKPIDDAILFRNSGLFYDHKDMRSYEQMLSTEGIVSAFFYNLVNSDINKYYQDKTFYNQFLQVSDTANYTPENKFSVYENAYLKFFYIISKYVYDDYSENSNLFDFINGYIAEFPDEAEIILKVFKETTSYDYRKPAKEIWLLKKNFDHQFISLIQYGATLPFYSININTANTVDFFAIGIDESDSEKLIEERINNGCYNDINDAINRTASLNDNSKNILLNSDFDIDYVEKQFEDFELNLKSLLAAILIHFCINSLFSVFDFFT
ncbi:hypothetical protein ACFLSE_05970 [Bacteroidota bacterium]